MKGNPILGTGSGSIGDVTVMRRNGSQVTRVRLRKIKNPMSQGQAEQRMYMAPILKFYSPLSKVLETSFEGLNKADSYAKFISVNANLARANGWGVKKGAGFVALPYKIAGGSMPTPIYIENYGLDVNSETNINNLGSLSRVLIEKYGLQEGDQVTMIAFAANDKADNLVIVYDRIYINTSSTDAIPSRWHVDTGALCLNSMNVNNFTSWAFAFIFSRYDAANQKWLRSDTFVSCEATYISQFTGAENLAAAIASYMKSAGQTPVSDVYLNGSDD